MSTKRYTPAATKASYTRGAAARRNARIQRENKEYFAAQKSAAGAWNKAAKSGKLLGVSGPITRGSLRKSSGRRSI